MTLPSGDDTTVLVVGLGELGTAVLERLTASDRIGRLIGASRRGADGEAIVNHARLSARLVGGPARVEHAAIDLDDPGTAVDAIRACTPDVIVAAASGHAWWRVPEDQPALAALPFAAFLPLHVGPTRSLMLACAAAGSSARVVCLPFPDAVGPMLAGLGLAPTLGAGNLAEVAAKLQALAARDERVPPSQVRVRLVAHHAAERDALAAFAALGGTGDDEAARAPWHAEVAVGGRLADQARVAAWFSEPYPLPPGRASQGISAAAAAAMVHALLGAEPVALHAPSPGGRPGGYPVLVSRDGVTLDLPAGLDERAAVDINERAAAWDGIRRIGPDGSVELTEAATAALRTALGVEVGVLRPDDHLALASALRTRMRAG